MNAPFDNRDGELAAPWRPGTLGSLWDMLWYDSGAILRAVTSLRELENIIQSAQENEDFSKSLPMQVKDCNTILARLSELRGEIIGLNTRVTLLTIDEFKPYLKGKNRASYKSCADWIRSIGVTLRRELSLTHTFCIEPKHEDYFAFKLSSIDDDFERGFPSAVYEFDEAGKCLALGRSTATVFHLLRAMEVGIRATARCLGVPDPVKDAERNWGKVLEKIRAATDARNKAGNWSGHDKELFQSLHVSLDAVRVAWRNTTMHVENKYTDDEAEHIFVAVRGFMKKLASRCDEQGLPLA